MKKLYFATTFCFFILLNCLAQNNIIKVNVLSLFLGNFSFQDEYSLNGHSSVALGFSIMPTRHLPKIVTKNDPTQNAINLTFNSISVTPEYRYYFKGEGPKGSYLSVYGRYSKFNTDNYKFTYSTDLGDENVTLSGDYTVKVIGLMLGSQYVLGGNFTLDWWIIGAGFGYQKGEYTGTGKFSDQAQQDIKDEVSSIKVPLTTVSVTTSSSEVKLTVEPKFPAFRSFGLCLGFRF